MVTHSGILAWRIPRTEEPGSPWGSKELQHDFDNPSLGFPDGTMVNNLQADAGDFSKVGSFPESGRSPVEGHSNLAYWATMHRVAMSRTRLKQLSIHSTSL